VIGGVATCVGGVTTCVGGVVVGVSVSGAKPVDRVAAALTDRAAGPGAPTRGATGVTGVVGVAGTDDMSVVGARVACHARGVPGA
jgi:hypothetical protein